MATEAQRKAIKNYRKKVHQVIIRFYPSERDIFEWMEQQDTRAGYIKGLIREDMERKKSQ